MARPLPIRVVDEAVHLEIRDVNGTLIPQKPSDPETPMAISHIVRALMEMRIRPSRFPFNGW